MQLVTTKGERFASIDSVDNSGPCPIFRVGKLIDRKDLPANAAIFKLDPETNLSLNAAGRVVQ